MVKPLDEFEADLYGESGNHSSLRLWHFFVSSIFFFTVGTMFLVISQTIGTGTGSHFNLIPLGGIFFFLGGALFSGWLFGVIVVVGTRIVGWSS